MINTDIPIYSVNDITDTITAIQEGHGGYEFTEPQMDAIYYFVSEVTGMSIDRVSELVTGRDGKA